MADRFYFPGDWTGPIVLDESESHHLSRVLRKTVGDSVELFDGLGNSSIAEVSKITKREVELRLTGELRHQTPPAIKVTLAVAPPKGDRFRWLIEKATELGVERLVPINTCRGVVSPGDTKLDKLRQTMLSACKQCGRNRVMEIAPLTSLESLPSLNPTTPILFGACPDEHVVNTNISTACDSKDVTIAIGPEGGFTAEEQLWMSKIGAKPACVSPYVLRIETAAIAVASVLLSKSL